MSYSTPEIMPPVQGPSPAQNPFASVGTGQWQMVRQGKNLEGFLDVRRYNKPIPFSGLSGYPASLAAINKAWSQSSAGMWSQTQSWNQGKIRPLGWDKKGSSEVREAVREHLLEDSVLAPGRRFKDPEIPNGPLELARAAIIYPVPHAG